MREIIVDNFAGGGGASTGIELAIGRSVDIAINHDENAIAMHKTNHPDTLHYCESVFDVDPVAATGGNPVGLAWFSPDCRHFSKAKGAKPVKKEIRGLAWVVIRWALAKRPRVMMLENVEEFKTWGPLLEDEMRPDPARTGETFAAFVGMLSTGINANHPALAEVCAFLSIQPDSEQARSLIQGLGYNIDYRELRACDFGAPTIRKRFFMVMRCDGESVRWPAPTHGDPKSLEVQSGRLAPWRTAAECIDWSLPCPSIFERAKPLAENTLKRIARGIERFVLNNPTPFIVKCNHTSTGHRADEPNGTVTAGGGGKSQLVTAFLAKHFGGNYTGPGAAMDAPAHTVTTTDHHAVVTSHLVHLRGTCKDGRKVDQPIPTVTAGGLHLGEVRAFLMKYYGNEKGGVSLSEPLGTVTTNDRFGLVTVDGADYQIVDIGMRMLQPHELYRAQGFPAGYIIDRDYRGNRYAKDKQVARCGNAVPPPFARALVEANLPEMCNRQQEVA
ncbi:DNA cytosine methyltransferase [Klebsiella aerogenes]|uniref:DNA cytosine methyltransferase n=1 Tax=Klebsiella aerogenes TaxID=548 RepID=UPI002A8312F8|nr:DNA cytosine methyltransferase [Klebsiella aerogenes]WPS51611.1 DNA cytosine methyltransferase [Klebsiella aerogenes]